MSFCIRLYVAASLTVIVFFGFLSWDVFSSYQQDHSNERTNAAQYSADAGHNGVDSCGAVMDEFGIFDWFTCLADVVNTDGGEKQAEYDLKAQQDMAAWAFGMLIVTVWLAVITLLGVLFVWRTLVATREMAEDARDIGRKQTQAYLSVSEVKFWVTDIRTPEFEVTIRNSGNSPSRSTTANVTLSTATEMLENLVFPKFPIIISDLGNGESFVAPSSDNRVLPKAPIINSCVAIKLMHGTVFENEPEETIFCAVFPIFLFDWPTKDEPALGRIFAVRRNGEKAYS